MLSYTRYPDLDFTHFISEGETTIQNWLETAQRYALSGINTRELYDLRQQTNLFSVEEVGMIVNRSMMATRLHPPNGRTAIVVDDTAKYSLAQIYALQAQNHEGLHDVQVFFALGEAIEWMGQDLAQCL
jgi:hypothetical protein